MRRFAISRSAEDREAATHKALATIQRRLTRIEKGGIEKGNGDG
jgi:hypothetical protein